MTDRILWGALFQSENQLDGRHKHIINDRGLPVLFRTRREAREWIVEHYGYIKVRKELRAEPHGWLMPRAVRVRVGLFEGGDS